MWRWRYNLFAVPAIGKKTDSGVKELLLSSAVALHSNSYSLGHRALVQRRSNESIQSNWQRTAASLPGISKARLHCLNPACFIACCLAAIRRISAPISRVHRPADRHTHSGGSGPTHPMSTSPRPRGAHLIRASCEDWNHKRVQELRQRSLVDSHG